MLDWYVMCLRSAFLGKAAACKIKSSSRRSLAAVDGGSDTVNAAEYTDSSLIIAASHISNCLHHIHRPANLPHPRRLLPILRCVPVFAPCPPQRASAASLRMRLSAGYLPR